MDITSNDDNFNKKQTNNYSIYDYDAKLALAFQSDLEKLLETFKSRGDFSFNSFSEIWKEMNFIAIFKYQDVILMLQVFIENCFHILKKFLSSNDLIVQTGALYAMYALFYKQPIKKWIKIRLTKSEMHKLNQIIEIHKIHNVLEPNFIYSKMRIDSAFHYCALSQPLGLDSKFLRRHDLSSEEINLNKSKIGVLEKFNDLFKKEVRLNRLQETEQEYQQLAKKYMEQNRELFIFPSKLNEELKTAFKEVFCMKLESGDESPVKKTKNKAMSNTNAVYRGDKKVFTALDLSRPSTSK